MLGLLLITNICGIALTFILGSVLPTSGQIAFEFGQGDTRSLYLFDINRRMAFQLARGTNPFPNYS